VKVDLVIPSWRGGLRERDVGMGRPLGEGQIDNVQLLGLRKVCGLRGQEPTDIGMPQAGAIPTLTSR
jgi:hypothetical protein